MIQASRARAWRYAAILLFCGAPLILLGVSLNNIMATSEANASAARGQAILSQIVTQVARHRARALTEGDKASLYLASVSATLARAELQETMGKLVAAAGGRLQEAQFVGTPEQEADGTVAIQLTLDIGNKGLFDLLYATETGVPLLDVTDLGVSRGEADRDAGAPPMPGASDLLHVELTVLGHWRKATG